MAIITRLIPHYTQPQGLEKPNPQYPTLRSLIHVQPGGKVIDLVKPSRGMAYDANIGGAIYSKGLYTQNHADGTSEIQATGACQYQTFSRIAIVRQNVAGGTISDSATSTGTGGAQWTIDASGLLVLNKANTVQIGASSALGLTTGVEYVVGVTYDGSTVRFFCNGLTAGSNASAQTFTIESAATLFSRGGTAGVNEQLNGAIGLHADFEGALPDSVMQSLTANPWQLYAPRKRQIYVSVASGGISGTLSQTLGDASASATGTVKIAGTTSSTLGAVTSSATGTLAIVGSASPTLGAVTSTATGTVAIVGTLSTTLDAATLAATGVLTAPGTGVVNQSLSDATLSATGTVAIVGSASVNLGALGLSSASAIRINASLAQTLASATLSATGAAVGAISGTASVTLGSLTLSAAGQGLWADVARASTVWTDAADASGIWTEI